MVRALLVCTLILLTGIPGFGEDDSPPTFEVIIDETTSAFVAQLEANSNADYPLYDPDYGESEADASAKAAEWGTVLDQQPGVVVPTEDAYYFAVLSGEIQIPGEQNVDPWLDTAASDNLFWGPRESISARETLKSLMIAVNVIPFESTIHKRSDGASGWNIMAAWGRIKSQLAEHPGSWALTSADDLRTKIEENIDDSMELARDIADVAEGKGIVFNHLIVNPSSAQNTFDIGIDAVSVALAVLEGYVQHEIAEWIQMPPLSVLDVVGIIIPGAKPFTTALSCLTYDSIPYVDPQEYVSAGEEFQKLMERGVVDVLVVDVAETGERLANTVFGVPIAGTVRTTAGAKGASLIVLNIEPSVAESHVVGLSDDSMKELGCSNAADCYRSVVFDEGVPETPMAPFPWEYLPILTPPVLDRVQHPSMTIRRFVNSPPQLPSIPKQTYKAGVGGGFEIKFTVKDSDGDGITLSLAPDSPGGLSSVQPNEPGKLDAMYSYSCERGCPNAFDVTIRASDGEAQSQATFHVVRIENTPPEALADEAETPMGTAVQINVLANDSDPDGDEIEISSVSLPAHGTTKISNKEICYTPEPGFYGTDGFTYTVSDSSLSSTAQVTVEILHRNRAPVSSPSSLNETAQVYVRGGSGGLLLTMEPSWWHVGCLSITDADGDKLSIRIGSTPRHGIAGVMTSGVDGDYNVTITYQISNDTLRASHQDRDKIIDRFTVVAIDPYGEKAVANVNVTVEVLNRDPVVVADSASTEEGIPVTIAVLANDSDPDGDPLNVTSVTNPWHGTATIVGS